MKSDRYYAAMADRESHDHEVASKYKGRLYDSEGAYGRAANLKGGFRNRYRPQEERIVVRNPHGRDVSLSPTQNAVYQGVRHLEGQTLTATIIANSLGVAVSTVTRALTILSAFRLIAYDVTRGRGGGITFLSTGWADLKLRATAAWKKLNEQRQKVFDRYVRKLERSGYFDSGLNFALYSGTERNIYGRAT